MNRATAATAALAMGTMVAVATIVPAMAAPRPQSAQSVAHVKPATAHAKAAAKPANLAAQRAKLASPPTEITSDLNNGQYMTVVRCQGVDSPPPIQLGHPGTPLTVRGVSPSGAVHAMLQTRNLYKTVYTCTVVVNRLTLPRAAKATKVAAPKARAASCELMASARTGGGCTKHVTVNTGFGGLAPQVTGHHPAG